MSFIFKILIKYLDVLVHKLILGLVKKFRTKKIKKRFFIINKFQIAKMNLYLCEVTLKVSILGILGVDLSLN
jgi:hypothetical protein